MSVDDEVVTPRTAEVSMVEQETMRQMRVLRDRGCGTKPNLGFCDKIVLSGADGKPVPLLICKKMTVGN